MSLKSVVIGFVVILVIVLGISRILGKLSTKQGESTSYLQETVSLPQKVRGLTETREKQIREREQQFEEYEE